MRRLLQIALALFGLLVCNVVLVDVPLLAQDVSGITSPAPGAAIGGDVPIFGTAVIDSFQKYELHYKQEPSGDDAFIYFSGGTTPVINGQLGVWQAGGLPPGTYSIRLRVVKQDGNYAEFFAPNLSVNQQAPTAAPTETPSETATATATYTPAPQPTPAVGQVTQPRTEDELSATATPAPAPASAGDTGQAAGGGGLLLPTATPEGGTSADIGGAESATGNVTRELGESLSFDRLRTQFFNGMRISAAIFIGFVALLLGKRIFEWAWRRYG